MGKLKLSKTKIIFFVLTIIILLFVIIITANNNKLLNNIVGKQIQQESEGVLPLFSYVVCDNQDKEKIRILITLNSSDGLEYVKCPNEQIIDANGKTQVSIDYTVKENEDTTFLFKEKDKDEVSETVNINNDTTRETTFDIEKVTDVKGLKSAKFNKKSDFITTNYNGKMEYKIGKSGAWNNASSVSLLDYDLVRKGLVDSDGTITLFARINDTKGNIVEVSEKININTESVNKSIEDESLLKAIGRDDIKTGKYTVKVSSTTYNLIIYNVEGSAEIIGSKLTIGVGEDVATDTTDAKNMIVLKVNGDLNISGEVTAYSTIYGGPKGMTVYCTGTLTNKGTITMTGKGAKASGQNVYLWRNASGGYETVPASGASGAGRRYANNGKFNGKPGNDGSTIATRATGGGGAGSARDLVRQFSSAYSGAGGAGTSYSGGTGGGAVTHAGTHAEGFSAGNGASNGGARRKCKTYC